MKISAQQLQSHSSYHSYLQLSAPTYYPVVEVIDYNSTWMNLSIIPLPSMDRCGVISKHLVQYETAFTHELVTVSVPLNATSFQLNRLHPYYDYNFTVFAENQMGFGPNATVRQLTLEYSEYIVFFKQYVE